LHLAEEEAAGFHERRLGLGGQHVALGRERDRELQLVAFVGGVVFEIVALKALEGRLDFVELALFLHLHPQVVDELVVVALLVLKSL
jgi:hypothetical protein